ncbi:MAG: DUF1080 domain-containing protein [Fibrobacteria bacterium]
MIWSHKARFNFTLAIVLGLFCGTIFGQTPVVSLPMPDAEGWIKLFRGNNASDFFTYYSDRSKNNAFPDNTFKSSADTVVVSGTPTGHIIFKQPFSHYRIKFEEMMPDRLGNAGLLVHVQVDDPPLFGSFPRSIECQGDPGQGMGQVWCIGNVWVKVHATSNGTPQYNPTSPEITYGAKNDNSRQILGIKKPSMKVGEWVLMEAEVHGADSLEHLVRGETIIKYSNPHVAPPTNPDQVEKVLKSGLIAWQSEGVPVRYRNIMIKLFPEDPLYKSLYTTSATKDYRIFPKSETRPSLGYSQGAIHILMGEDKRSVMGRALRVRGM